MKKSRLYVAFFVFCLVLTMCGGSVIAKEITSTGSTTNAEETTNATETSNAVGAPKAKEVTNAEGVTNAEDETNAEGKTNTGEIPNTSEFLETVGATPAETVNVTETAILEMRDCVLAITYFVGFGVGFLIPVWFIFLVFRWFYRTFFSV